MPTSFGKSSVYFLCEAATPLLDRATSMPKKYLKGPKLFNLNFLAGTFLISLICHFNFIISKQDNMICIYNNASDLTLG